MPRHYRLTGTELRAIRPTRRIHGACFSLAISLLPDRASPGVAVVVSKKVAARAAKRNLIKRRTRAALLKVAGSFAPERAYVFTAKKDAARADFAAIEGDIRTLVAKAV